ncbi:hypothetical protein LK08_04895 [Streptomyces sp. MUSC 125]|uniref:hypothetical protein n=1 Tax=Streptomyces sp. MUSC 125 TaxID=1428624 RepID=UPI00057E361F|nr:hypothetical protein [Streptomyces sp. MUSC 125]KIE28024.1 hypothetical protein LK08_04895 [Streptomyces sp. MUSC 125]
MTAEHESADGRAYDGTDALMAAITGDPLPEDARRDPAFLAEYRKAEADVVVLKEQLAQLAEVLSGVPAPEEALVLSPLSENRPAGDRPGSVGHPVGPVRTRRSGRPSRPGRALRVALGSLAGAAAFSLVVGFGWFVVRSEGSDTAMTAGRDHGAEKAADAPGRASGDDGRPADPERVLACSQLVVEGTVTQVEPRKSSSANRITLSVIRSFKPAQGPAEVSFLLDAGAQPAPRRGQHVLVRVAQGQPSASLWAVGSTRVAVNRTWITETLHEPRRTTCPFDHPS